LEYSWNPAEKLAYDFDIEVELGSEKKKYHGRNTIQATGKPPQRTAADHRVEEGSGTGFVIHPRGYLVTCAHVVKGATRIDATIGDVKYNAKVLKLDFENDLAILRIDTDGLSFLKFAKSGQVRLGQTVRAIGFPLSDVLGKTIKVTKGEVSGRGGPAGTDGLQIDATINPGNSGGPLVDNAGRLVGVTSSMLAGAGISEVGFAIPSDKVTQLVNTIPILIEFQNDAPELPSPEIVDLVRQATVLLEVTTGPGGVGIKEPHELEYFSHWYETRTHSSRSLLYRAPQHKNFNGKIQVDSAGEVIQDDQKGMLPWLLGSVSRVGIESLPSSAPGRTVSTQLVAMQEQPPQSNRVGFDPYVFGNFGSRRSPPWIRQSVPEKSQTMIGTESTTIVLGKRTDDRIAMEKTHSLKFAGKTKDATPIVIKGSGEGEFDPVAGRVISMNYKTTITVNQKNVSLRIPITMKYQLVSEAQLAEEQKAIDKRKQERAKKMTKSNPTTDKESSFRSPSMTRPQQHNDLKYESVKSAPESSNLNKFDFDK
jgi:hypothetical protein